MQRFFQNVLIYIVVGDVVRWLTAQDDIDAAPRHVGGHSDRCRLSGLGDDVGFLLVELGVEHLVGDALSHQHVADPFRGLDGGSADQHRTLLGVEVLHLVADGLELGLFRAKDLVRVVVAYHLPVGGDGHHFQLVYLGELLGLRGRRSGHAGQLLVQAEVILEGDGGQGHRLPLDLHVLLGFNGLVQSLRVAAPRHHASGELIDDDHLAVLHHVVLVSPEQYVSL